MNPWPYIQLWWDVEEDSSLLPPITPEQAKALADFKLPASPDQEPADHG